jgi:hypothetical protein
VILVGVGTGYDQAVSDSVAVITSSSNGITSQIHDHFRFEPSEIAAFITSSQEQRIIFVSHGSRFALVDASAKRLPYLQATDASIFQDCYVLAHACSAAASLGIHIVKCAYVFVGFDAPISAPPTGASPCILEVRNMYTSLLIFFNTILYVESCVAVTAAQDFLEELRAQATEAQAKFDTSEGSTLPADDLICIRQFGNALCIWIRGHREVIKARAAPASPALW